MKFKEAERQFQKLEHERHLGYLDAQAYESAISQIRIEDESGNLWMLQPYSGQWHVLEAGRWRPATPPRARPAHEGTDPKLEEHPGPPPAAPRQWAAPQPKKSKKGWMVGGGLVLVIGALVCLVAGLVAFGVISWGLFSTPDVVETELIDDIIDTEVGDDIMESVLVEAIGDDTINISGDQAGHLVTPEGVEVYLPPSSVEASDQVQVRVTAMPDEQMVLPDDLLQVGEVYIVEMEGGDLLQPVYLSLPIPDGVPAEELIGLTTFDEANGRWTMVPSSIDEETGLVTASLAGFSPFGLTGTSCGYVGARRDNCQTDFGQTKMTTLEITNKHKFGSSVSPRLPDQLYSSNSVTYGICVMAYSEVDDPEQAHDFVTLSGLAERDWCRLHGGVEDRRASRGAETMEINMPAGTYTIIEVGFASEINPGRPGYIPVYGRTWRPVGTMEFQAGQTYTFSNSGKFIPADGWKPWIARFLDHAELADEYQDYVLDQEMPDDTEVGLGSPPKITAIEFPEGNVMDPSGETVATIPGDGESYVGWLHFEDEDGDVDYLTVSLIDGDDLSAPGWDIYFEDARIEGDLFQGKLWFWFRCGVGEKATSIISTYEIKLEDEAGNWSGPAYLRFQCEY